MGLKLVIPAASEPITLADLKLQCRVDTTDDDALLTACIAAARAKAENYTETALISQTWEQTLDAFPAAEIELRKPPVTSITSVTYLDAAGATQTLSSTLYTLDTATFPGWLLPKFNTLWPDTQGSANCVTMRYVTGYVNAAAVPADIVAWLKLTGAFLYAQRESIVLLGRSETMVEIPSRYVDSLLEPYRVFKV